MSDERTCGSCSLCCTVLRVDELAKLGGRPCLHQSPEGGCRVHADRPAVCRAYRCAWLGGAFQEDDRPDRLGAVLDLVPRGQVIHLVVRLAGDEQQEEVLARSPRLRELVAETRLGMPVEIRDVEDVLDPDRPYRLLQPDGDELEIEGDRVRVIRGGRVVSERRAAWFERVIRHLRQRLEAWRLQRWPSHEDQLARLGLPGGKLGDPPQHGPREEEDT